jgi:hypothetical protein
MDFNFQNRLIENFSRMASHGYYDLWPINCHQEQNEQIKMWDLEEVDI